MKIFSFALLIIILFFSSCAGGPEVSDITPDWADTPLEDTSSLKAFRGSGNGETLASAKAAAIDNLRSEILAAMEIESSGAFNAMFEEIAGIIANPGSGAVDGVEIVHNEGWMNSRDSITYIVDLSWDKAAFEKQRAYLAELNETASPGYKDMEIRAGDAESDGNFYEAAIIWAAAAGIARENGNNSGYRNALDEVVKAIDNLEYLLNSYPDKTFVGLRPESPVLFLVSSRGKPVSNAEFVITYPKNDREGSPSRAQARVVSDDNGVVRFLPPEVPFAGTQIVTIAPGADPFLEYFDGNRDKYTQGLIDSLETPRMQAEYEALSRIRIISTGILILETDLAGNPLNTADTAEGLLNDLSADGFDISIMNLDPSQMLSRSDEALLRDLKADSRFSDTYQRVIHGTVALDSFEQNGDNFTVKVSGTLTLSDINRQITLYKSEISKSSQASNSLQAISAAFRQLGRSFAGELIEQAP
ncbi:MAG: hypothetical protein J7L76_02465 [Spirochaetaceae bacterium]|nr:hypothetical protein [Spirochaetaceae bacterium]RKX89136.1 MAG: hypothetical protein DRP70_04625 [Spirochaetota bacterium]RKX97732.1 MAG: hypothetical protein DRZ90_05335 [Spirochaetota bacterium]